MATAEALRTRVRTRLEEATAAVWTDAEIDECVAGALDIHGLRFPVEAIDTVTILEGATSASAPAGTRTIQRVTLADHSIVPRRGRPDSRTADEALAWELVAGQLLFTQPLPAQVLTIHHTIAPGLANLPPADEILVVLGAVCQALEARAIQDFKRGGQLPLHSSVITYARETWERAVADRSHRLRAGVVAV